MDDMSNPDSSNNDVVLSTTVGKCFRGRHSVTVSVQEDFDEDQFGDAFVSDHRFCHSVNWKSDNNKKQCIGRRISFENIFLYNEPFHFRRQWSSLLPTRRHTFNSPISLIKQLSDAQTITVDNHGTTLSW
jgi:hypothetical protein